MAVTVNPGTALRSAGAGHPLIQTWTIAFTAQNDNATLDLSDFRGGYGFYFMTAVSGTVSIRTSDDTVPTNSSGAWPGAASGSQGLYYVGSKTGANGDPSQLSRLPRYLNFIVTGVSSSATIFFEAHNGIAFNKER